MAELNQNGIKFNISNDPIFIYGVNKVTNSANVDTEGNYNSTKVASKGKATPVVNCVDIDWNGAQLKNGSTVKATLNTTGEMLSILQTA